jgi:hypothetical protein
MVLCREGLNAMFKEHNHSNGEVYRIHGNRGMFHLFQTLDSIIASWESNL